MKKSTPRESSKVFSHWTCPVWDSSWHSWLSTGLSFFTYMYVGLLWSCDNHVTCSHIIMYVCILCQHLWCMHAGFLFVLREAPWIMSSVSTTNAPRLFLWYVSLRTSSVSVFEILTILWSPWFCSATRRCAAGGEADHHGSEQLQVTNNTQSSD